MPTAGWAKSECYNPTATRSRWGQVRGEQWGHFRVLRPDPDLRLGQWWSERTVASWFPCVHPDGLGLRNDYGDEITFFLEHDTGSENLGLVVDKLTGYEHLAQVGPTYPVLFCLPSRERERNLHTELAGHRRRVTVRTYTPRPRPPS
jgi:hypothetical protein